MFQVNPLLGRGFTCKNQALFSLKDKSKKLKCRLLQFLFGALRVKILFNYKTRIFFSFLNNSENLDSARLMKLIWKKKFILQLNYISQTDLHNFGGRKSPI